MKSKLATAALIVSTLFVTVAATAQETDTDRAHPMTFVKDSVITTKIKAKLGDDQLSSLIHVRVDTDAHGAVVLSGYVKSADQADRAVMIAKGTEGVTSVRNDLLVKGE